MNLLIAFLWMFLQDEWSILTFFGGYLVGLFVLFTVRRFLPTSFYLKKLLLIIKLFILFIRELISSSILVARQVTRPKINVTPGIFTLDTDLEGDLEVTLLALLLSLTPGSVVVEMSPDSKQFFIHAMDIPKSSDGVKRSSKIFEKAIKDVTR